MEQGPSGASPGCKWGMGTMQQEMGHGVGMGWGRAGGTQVAGTPPDGGSHIMGSPRVSWPGWMTMARVKLRVAQAGHRGGTLWLQG